MNDSPSSRVLRLLDRVLGVARFLLMIITGIFIVLGGLTLVGTASTNLSGTTEQVAIEHVLPNGQVAIHHPSEDLIQIEAGPRVDNSTRFDAAKVSIDVEDRTTRAAAVLVISAWLGLGWLAITNVRGITRSALTGSPFTTENARRLRRTGAAALGYAAMLIGVPLLMDALLSRVDLPVDGFRLDGGGGDAWLWFIVGLLIIAIAGAFERGVELQELEEATI